MGADIAAIFSSIFSCKICLLYAIKYVKAVTEATNVAINVLKIDMLKTNEKIDKILPSIFWLFLDVLAASSTCVAIAVVFCAYCSGGG